MLVIGIFKIHICKKNTKNLKFLEGDRSVFLRLSTDAIGAELIH